MRKRLLLPALLLLLGGCAAAPAEPASPFEGHTGFYAAELEIVSDTLAASASISHLTPDACTVTYTAPPSLAGMEYTFRDGSIDLSYKGLTFQFDPASLPDAAPARIVVDTLTAVFRDPGVTVDQSGAIRGILPAGEFTMQLGEDGAPAKLSVPSQGMDIQLRGFRFQD